jgi:hypothetical protein
LNATIVNVGACRRIQVFQDETTLLVVVFQESVLRIDIGTLINEKRVDAMRNETTDNECLTLMLMSQLSRPIVVTFGPSANAQEPS